MIKFGPRKISSMRAPRPKFVFELSRPNRNNFPCFRHRRIARPRKGVRQCKPSRCDCLGRRKAAEKLPAGSLRLNSAFKLLTLIKVGPRQISSLRAPGPQLVLELSRPYRNNFPFFRNRRTARPCRSSRCDCWGRKKAAEKLPDGSL